MNLVACVDKNFGIGKNNQLLFDNAIDMAYFKRLTTNKVVVMGRVTFDQLTIKPLPNRINIVLSHNVIIDEMDISNAQFNKHKNPNTVLMSAKNVDELLTLLTNYQSEDIYICGGQSVYDAMSKYCDYAYINKMDKSTQADTFIQNFDLDSSWQLVNSKLEHNIQFCLYKNLLRNKITSLRNRISL